jgi:hypothetical protein
MPDIASACLRRTKKPTNRNECNERSQASAALANAQNELAFRKRRVRKESGDPERDSLVAGWREDIRRLRLAEDNCHDLLSAQNGRTRFALDVR